MDHLDLFQETEESRTLKLCHHRDTVGELRLPEYYKGIVIFASVVSKLEEYHCLRTFGFCFCINASARRGEFSMKVLLPGVGVGNGTCEMKTWLWKEYVGQCYFFLPHIELDSHIWKKYYFLLIKFCWTWLRVTIGWKSQVCFFLTQAIPSSNLTVDNLVNLNFLTKKIIIELTNITWSIKKNWS